MLRRLFAEPFVGYVIVAAVFLAYFFINWLQRRSEPDIMRRRVNEGSDAYFADHDSALSDAKADLRDTFGTRE